MLISLQKRRRVSGRDLLLYLLTSPPRQFETSNSAALSARGLNEAVEMSNLGDELSRLDFMLCQIEPQSVDIASQAVH